MAVIQIPDFDFAIFYYGEILESLMAYKRINVPEHTDESAQDPLIQHMRMTALVGHLNNVNIDAVANESTLPTSRLVEQVRNMLRLIDYEMSPASPSSCDILYELAKVLTATTVVVTELAQSSTKREGDEPIIYFEALSELEVERTDQFSYVLAEEAGAFADYTSDGNNQVGGNEFTPWSTPDVKDAVYFGHKQALWSLLQVNIALAASGILGVWEYYDGDFRKTAPTSVTDMTGYLRIDLTSYLGTSNRAGTLVRVQVNESTAFEDLESQWVGGANIVETTGYLGQTTPSLDPADYTVGSDWQELTGIIDGTSDLTGSGDVEYSFPQNVTEDWVEGEVDGKTAYWMRYRITEVSTPSSPDIDYARMDTDKQYIVVNVTQGRSKTDDPLGSSDGTANQRFETSEDHYINGSAQVWVDSSPWVEVNDFLSSEPGDTHFRVELGEDDRATIVFSDGNAGRIPPSGINNVVCQFRYGADNNGNVGARTVSLDKTGLTNINSLINPRSAGGWDQAEGATDESLEQAKIAGPASLRVKEVALSSSDVEILTIAFVDDDGSSPFSRALAIEEGFGPKTVEVVVVASGGLQASAAQIAALELYLNGDRYSVPPVQKRIVQNQEATAVNFTEKVIDIVATVKGDTTQEAIEAQLAQVIQPEALKEDGATYEWEFGGEVTTSRISHEIFKVDQSITDVDITTPPADVGLLQRELPVLGTVSITIV